MYSIGYQEAVLKYYHSGHSYRETCDTFDICMQTLSNWLKKEKTGSLAGNYHGTKPKIDRDALKAYIDEHPDAYQRELAEEFGFSQPCICYNLQKIGYSLKKRTPLCRAGPDKSKNIPYRNQWHQIGKPCLCG